MRRREFIALVGAVAGWPLAARAQQPDRMRRIAMLTGLTKDSEGQARFAAFQQGLQVAGWTEGRNFRIEDRWGGGDADRLRAYAAELVKLGPDVILAGGTRALEAMQQETHSIPTVFVASENPVVQGLVASLARPGGNVTGFTDFEPSLAGKLLEVLKEAAPHVSRVALIVHPDNPAAPSYLSFLEIAGKSLAVQPIAVPVRDPAEIQHAVEAFAREPNGGLLVPPDQFLLSHRELMTALAAKHRLPAIYGYRPFVDASGLMSYGADNYDLYRRAASYVDRILRGEKPADLPVQTPTKFELVINLKTAKVLGLEVPLHLQQRADEVIE
jgi:putative tryptophan/tyrosine transport system substrate-binding protein